MLLPRSIVAMAGVRLVLIDTAVRLLRDVLAPPPPPPRQLPLLRQTVALPVFMVGIMMVELAVGVAKTRLVVKPALVALKDVVALPCRFSCWPLLPMVRVALGLLMVVRAVRDVMSALVPLPAALRLALAPEAVVAPVPPLVIARALSRVMLKKLTLDVVVMF